MKKTNKIGLCLIIFIIVISPAFQIFKMSPIGNSSEMSGKDKLLHSSDIINTKQWITNGDFSSQENWTVVKGGLGDPTDVDASISNDEANYQVLGFNDRFAFEENYNMGASWVETNHPSFPDDPAFGNIVAGEGFRAEHSWEDNIANQVPSVQWEQNFTLPVNMSDYIITSASVSAGLNATVDSNIDTVADGVEVNSARTGGFNVDTYSVGDYIRFYVSISDLQKTKTYEIAYTQSTTLGYGDAGSTDNLAQKLMSTLSQADLIYYLSSVLETDYRNFTLIVGIRFNCEDNVATDYDYDYFDRAVINSINLTFDYEKKIDLLTSISWNQVGDKPSDISGNPIVINSALLNFQYKINETWPTSSPNSEFKILINDIQHSETVKLSEGTITPKDAKTGGFDVTSLIDKDENVNLSLQVYLADQFELDRTIKISIDNVYLNITYTEIIDDIETDYELYLNTEDKTLDPVISIPLGENLNITVKYLDNQTKNNIPGATVQLEGKVSGNLTLDINQYSIIINTSDLGVGVKTLTVVAQKTDYDEQNIPFFVEVTERETELLLNLNSDPKNDSDTIQVKVDEFINVTVVYRDNATERFLSGATVTLLGDLTGELNETNGFYNITIDTDDLDQGINAFTVFAQLEDYKPQSIQFFVELIERETNLMLFLDGEDKTADPSIQRYDNQLLNITISYTDSIGVVHIPNAIVDINGSGISEILVESFNNYTVLINTADLNQGINFLTIYARKMNYEAQTILLTIEIIQIETDLTLFLDGEDKTADPSIQRYDNQLLNITISYTDSIGVIHIPNAIVDINGSGISEILVESFNNYTVLINTVDLNQGVNFLTIFVRKDGYEAQTILLIIEIIQIETNLTLFLDGEDKTADPSIQLYDNQLLNITISYTDSIGVIHIPNAIVDINGSGISEILVESFNNYTVLINTVDLNQGVNFLTIYARKKNYEPLTILLIIEIIEKETELLLVLDGVPTNDGEQIQVEVNDFINVTVYYRDNITKQLLSGATITLIGRGIFTETSSHYNITVNTNLLDQGITVLTVFAQMDNYLPQTIQFFVEVVERESELELFLDDLPFTLDPVIEVMIGNILNITVYYTDNQTGVPIIGALVQLIGEGDILNFKDEVNQYSIYLNTTDLKIGVSLFTIVAQANNFQIRTIDLRITTNRIKITTSTLSGESIVTGLEGDTIRLGIILNNTNILPSGELITNATVTYKWDYGQGELPEYDGTYEVDLVNVPSGTYIITITASAGDDYTFEIYEITLTVGTVTPPDFSGLIIILTGAFGALVIGFTLYEVRFKYPATVRQSRKIRKKIKKGRKTKPIKDLASREDLIKVHLESNVETIDLEKKTENGLKDK